MSLRGNGLECPVVEGEPGAEEAERAGETAVLPVLLAIRWEDREEVLELEVLGELPERPLPDGLMAVPGCTLITPAAIPPETGNNNACGGGKGST